MHFTSDSLLPENQQPLVITVAPFGAQRLPADYTREIAVSWKDQVQEAVDCYNAGATVLHFNVRDPKTGKISENLADYCDFIGLLRQAVPKMILQLDGSITLTREPDQKAGGHGHNTRHMLTEIDPKPDQVTVALGMPLMLPPRTTADDEQEKQFASPVIQHAPKQMSDGATPAFDIEYSKLLRERSIQPYFPVAQLHHLDELEQLISTGVYMGPLNHTLTAIGGSGFSRRNPFDFVESVRRSPPGSVMTMESVGQTLVPFAAIAIAFGVHVRCGTEDNLQSRNEALSSVQQVDQIVRLAKELKRPVATGEQARQILKLGVWYNSSEETMDALWAHRPTGGPASTATRQGRVKIPSHNTAA